MAHFSSPCQSSVLLKTDAAPMPELTLSIYQTSYVSPQLQRSRCITRPPVLMTEQAGMRLLPYTIAQKSSGFALQFIDDTPPWKRLNRAAAAVWWKRPLAERREFARTLEWRMRKKVNRSQATAIEAAAPKRVVDEQPATTTAGSGQPQSASCCVSATTQNMCSNLACAAN